MSTPSSQPPARFTQGSTFRHVVEMTVTGAIGLIAIFFVDFLSLYYISLMGNDQLTAGVGYATNVLFLAISVNIGAMIAGTALLSRALGAGKREDARRIVASGLAISIALGVLVSIALLASIDVILEKIGAEGTPRDVARRFLWIVLPSTVFMSAGMMLSGYLRGVGDAKRAMSVTLIGGIVTAFTDPLLIFTLKLGTDGAAIATVISRIVFTLVGLNGIVRVHKLAEMPSLAGIRKDFQPFFAIAFPAILTNIATPIGVLIFVSILAPFGAEAIAASAIIDRLIPLVFGLVFALSASIGAILGQNLGARQFGRVRQAMRDALKFSFLYTLAAWLLLALLRNQIAAAFGIGGLTAHYLTFFCLIGAAAWIFISLVLVANAAFNNLGFPLYATAFNWGRSTIGTLPFAYIGALYWGVEGAQTGVIFGAAIFGLWAVHVCFKAIDKLEARATSTVG
ncbi:MAG: MATE family efflux transporter [Proteobacteria bacterium]|nr:MATE family efflux transporter [Pseudomonadota bacterium]